MAGKAATRRETRSAAQNCSQASRRALVRCGLSLSASLPINTITHFSRLTRRVMFPTRRRPATMRKLTNPLVGREDFLQTLIKIKAAPRTKQQQTPQPRDDHADCPMLVPIEIHQPRMLLLLQLLPVQPGRKQPTMNHAEPLHEVQRDRDL